MILHYHERAAGIVQIINIDNVYTKHQSVQCGRVWLWEVRSDREGKQWNQIEFREESWMKEKSQRILQIKRKIWTLCHLDVFTFYKDVFIIHIILLNIVCTDQI